MLTYSQKMKLCSTFVRWSGPRSTDPIKAFVSTQSPTTRSEFTNGGYNHGQMPATSTCHYYEKLSVLR